MRIDGDLRRENEKWFDEELFLESVCEDSPDEDIDRYVEIRRNRYREEFFEYLMANGNDPFDF